MNLKVSKSKEILSLSTKSAMSSLRISGYQKKRLLDWAQMKTNLKHIRSSQIVWIGTLNLPVMMIWALIIHNTPKLKLTMKKPATPLLLTMLTFTRHKSKLMHYKLKTNSVFRRMLYNHQTTLTLNQCGFHPVQIPRANHIHLSKKLKSRKISLLIASKTSFSSNMLKELKERHPFQSLSLLWKIVEHFGKALMRTRSINLQNKDWTQVDRMCKWVWQALKMVQTSCWQIWRIWAPY